MNVLFVSQCDKRALVETRRILDQFAERRGSRTWQTPITQAGLDTVRRMLKKTARKNTAVACHWIRGLDHSELVWIVGTARRFNAQGAVPTNTTETDVLRRHDENDWHSATDITLLAAMASLFHDFGKASRIFQAKLKSNARIADPYRHEWVSLRLFEAFVAVSPNDQQWLRRLAAVSPGETAAALARLTKDGIDPKAPSPFRAGALPPLAQAVGWLVVSHHRLPCRRDGNTNAAALRYLLGPITAEWNDARSDADAQHVRDCWDFPDGLPFDSGDWCKRAQRCASGLLKRPDLVSSCALLDDPYVMHLARLALMLADHNYSRGPSKRTHGDQNFPLYANTDATTRKLKQRLDEHLVGVAAQAQRIVRALPRLERELPRIARCKAFQRRATDERFRWQDRAYDLAAALAEQSARQGFFGVNMASTGCGKTLANARILYGLADPLRGARFSVALGLRTLTLQTGAAYRERLRLGEDDLAVMVGGGAVRELFELGHAERQAASRGSESAEDLLLDDSHVYFEGSLADGPLKAWLETDSKANKLLQAPVLVCTIDHLVPATEGVRGGRQIMPMLRLLSSDLVLDEPDDFDLGDLPAISRLIHWAGLLGSRVLLSSATLPPALVEGLYGAYRAGREAFQRHRGIPGSTLDVPCAWFDEFGCESHSPQDAGAFRQAHATFVDRRLSTLRRSEPRRAVRIVPTVSQSADRATVCRAVAASLPGFISELHAGHHVLDEPTGKRVSFGLVRMANIDPLITVAQELIAQGAPTDARFHLCVYHARHPLLVRSAIERQLDGVLQRADPLQPLRHPSVRKALDHHPEPDQVFVVLASPVAEVGRDHDYDWAVVEPSSMRSIIQLAGRIRRHRSGAASSPNLLLLGRGLRALRGACPAYFRPGFEDAQHLLRTHDMEHLIAPGELSPLDAGPRIRARSELHPDASLTDLEHRQLEELMLSRGVAPTAFTVPDWWRTRANLTGQLQHSQRFRKGAQDLTFALLPRDEDASDIAFFRFDEGWVSAGHLLQQERVAEGDRLSAWGVADYGAALTELAQALDRELLACAQRYGTVPLRESTHGWAYHPWLGFKTGA